MNNEVGWETWLSNRSRSSYQMAYLLVVSLKHFILLISISSISVSCNIQAEKKIEWGLEQKYLENPSLRLMLNLNYVHAFLTLLHQSVPWTSACISCRLLILFKYTEHLFKNYFEITLLFVCVWHSHSVAHMWRLIRGQFVEGRCLLPPCGSRWSGLGNETWQSASFLISSALNFSFLKTVVKSSSHWHWLLHHIMCGLV